VKPRAKSGWQCWLRRFIKATLAGLLLCAAVVAYANVTAVWASRGRIFDDVSQVPKTRVGLLFGTTDRVSGRENLYFRYRIEAAAKLWKAGKVELIIVSGSQALYYNEPAKMQKALIARGIPESRIICDIDGVRTLDSVVRAKEIFGVDSMVVISQRFQNERAIYIAQANGIDAYGFEARDVEPHAGLKTKFREVGARVIMWLDVNLLGTRPRKTGGKIALPD
jgi:SanA protein